jgi:hypothetical protein
LYFGCFLYPEESVSEGNANIDKQIEEFEKLEEVVVRFKKGMDNLKEYINQAVSKDTFMFIQIFN